ncbi:MAG: MBL fold metallo-hydrolase [Clostridia bacterium]|nr:MBL fold metallo-hydrolase [Clostridia bacterium]
MRIQFLGTGAADWKAVPEDHPGYRYFSSAVIDGELLIDPGPDVFKSGERYNIDLSGIKYVINTHRHGDHFTVNTLQRLLDAGAEFIPLRVGETVQLSRCSVSAFAANHGTCPDAVHFLIDDGDKRLYYALDGAWLLYEEYQALKRGADLLVLDATIGDVPGDYRIFEHNNLNMVREMRETLRPYVKEFIVSHMALTLHGTHEELEKALAACGIKAARDGLEIEI